MEFFELNYWFQERPSFGSSCPSIPNSEILRFFRVCHSISLLEPDQYWLEVVISVCLPIRISPEILGFWKIISVMNLATTLKPSSHLSPYPQLVEGFVRQDLTLIFIFGQVYGHRDCLPPESPIWLDASKSTKLMPVGWRAKRVERTMERQGHPFQWIYTYSYEDKKILPCEAHIIPFQHVTKQGFESFLVLGETTLIYAEITSCLPITRHRQKELA